MVRSGIGSPLSERARQLYLIILNGAPAPAPDDPAMVELLDFGLVTPHPDAPSERFIALDPVIAATRRRDRRLSEASEALREAAELADSVQDLAIAYRMPQPGGNCAGRSDAAVERLIGMEAVNGAVSQIVAECTQELLTALPAGPRRAEMLAISQARDLDALRRGVAMRTLYRSSARTDPATARSVSEVTAAGAHIRTLDDPFEPGIVVDRRIAVISDHTPWTGHGPEPVRAVVVREPAMAHRVAAVFDRDWARATPWSGVEETGRADLTDLQIAVLQQLTSGTLQHGIGEELGVSSRSVSHQISQIKAIAGVETLFQLAVWWTRRALRDDPR